MLKLEKIGKTLDIGISLRQRNGFFDPPLLKALGIAVALHLMAGLLFQVSPFKIVGNQTLFAPVLVDFEINTDLDNTIIALVESEEAQPRSMKEPRGAFLEVPEMVLSERIQRPNFVLFEPEMSVPSLDVREEDAALDWLALKLPTEMGPSIQIILTGDLAERAILDDGLLVSKDVSLAQPYRAVYAVQVDDRTGTVFWYEPKQREESDNFSEKMLQHMRFQVIEDSFVTAGEIEIHFKRGVSG